MAAGFAAYAGSYTRGGGGGIYVLDVDPAEASYRLRSVYPIENPIFLAPSADGRFLYSTCDEGTAAFSIAEDGALTLLNKAGVNGLRPSYLSVTRKNKFLVSGGYHDGKLTVQRLNKDGSIGSICDEIFHEGLGNVVSKHYNSHISCAVLTPDERYVLAVDVGVDQVRIYHFDHRNGKLELSDILRCPLESGPRDLAFSPDGRTAYITFESLSQIAVYRFDPESAAFTELGRVSTLTGKQNLSNISYAVRVSEDGKHVLVTNSGENSVAVYNVAEDGKLDTKCVLPVSGEFPIDLLLMPGGKMFSTVNQEGDTVTSFNVNYDKGYFLMKRKPLKLKDPTCIRLVRLPE
ncbi:MAG: lactonase family protein [Lachnospiraceae bacterium]|nr:lactonase family protein [Lachnospiraceae bacterium]